MRSIAVAAVAVMSWATAAHAAPDSKSLAATDDTGDLPRERRFMTVQHVAGPGEESAAPTLSRTIYMNRCVNSCKITIGTTDSRTDKSQIGGGTLSAFKYGDASWAAVMSCMKDTFADFNVKITDKDPGTAEHMEIMVAGTGGQIGLPAGVLGVAELDCSAPGTCGKFLPNTIVYSFANDSYYGAEASRDLDICATAAQEIAHTWGLDHSIDKTDPMTYFTYAGMRTFKDGVMCGSDCVNGVGPQPFNLTCSGQTHTCLSTNRATQDEVKTILALFGPSCMDDSGCEAGYFCSARACLAGPTLMGGVGTACTADADCLEGSCAQAGSTHACANSCTSDAECPSGYSCLDAGKNDGTGVCWIDSSSGCCDTSGHSSGTGAMLLSLALGAAFVTSRKKRKK